MIYENNSNIYESPLAQKAYDSVFSLGEACLGATNLKASLLREYSCPFDWIAGGSFEQRIDILLNNFNGYFEKDKLELRQNLQNIQYIPSRYFFNKENGIHFIHDFPPENLFNMDNYYPFTKKKYDRRINRLLNTLNTKNLNILCVYIQLNITKISNDEIISLHDKLKQKFNANIDMLFIRNEPSFRMDELTLEVLSQNTFIANLNNKSIRDYDGNSRTLGLLLDNINTKKLLQIKQSSSKDTLYIYGCGGIGKAIAGRLALRNIGLSGFIVSDGFNISHTDLGKTYHLKKLPIPYSQATVIFGLNRENMNAVKEYLQKNGIKFGFEYY